MEKLPLRLKAPDAIKYLAKTQGPSIIIAIGLALFLGKVTLTSLFIKIIPVFIAIYAFVLFITCKSTSITLTTNGFVYKNWRGRDIVYLWNQPIEINKLYSKKTGTYSIKTVDNKKTIQVFKAVFSYPEVINFIKQSSPPNHKIRELIANDA